MRQSVCCWFLGLFIFLCAPAVGHAENMKVYLFIGLDKVDGTPYYRLGKNQKRVDQLREMFLERLTAFNLDPVVIERATEDQLAAALRARTTAAIFWIGHSNPGRSGTGLGVSEVILDADGNNVAPLFQNIHPNMRWLAVIGCDAQPILDKYKVLGYYDQNRILQFFSFDSLIEPTVGLIDAAAAGYSYLGYTQKQFPAIECFTRRRQGVQLMLTRQTPMAKRGSLLEIFVGDRLITTVEGSAPGQIQNHALWIDRDLINSNHKVTIEVRGSAGREVPEFGDISITDLSGHETHTVLRRANGRIMGTRQRIFRPNQSQLIPLELSQPGC